MPAPSPRGDETDLHGCMIGLFWTERDRVCLGSPPTGEDPVYSSSPPGSRSVKAAGDKHGPGPT